MLRTDIIELVNSGEAWAFVGSGVSAEAGLPGWRELVEGCLRLLPATTRDELLADRQFTNALQASEYDRCFSQIENKVGRAKLEEYVTAQLDPRNAGGRLTKALADWPFKGYVTSNYDDLLLRELRPLGGWIAVGNTANELPKVSRDASAVVWHVHGALALASDKSHLVLTQQDYEGIYLDGSPLEKQLRALLIQRRFVFIGFGFKDPELVRLLKIVSRYTNPAQPILAFLHDVPGYPERLDLLQRFNVDVIPYRVVNGSHSELVDLVETYSALVLGRSLRFGQAYRPSPSYDPETTGLLLYNKLALADGQTVSDDAAGTLVRARLLALLKHGGSLTVEVLEQDLQGRVEILRQAGGPQASGTGQSGRDAVRAALDQLRSDGHITVAGNEVALTDSGLSLTGEQAASAERLEEQFKASIEARIATTAPDVDEDARARIAVVTESFLKDSVTKRALGVALTWYSSRQDFQRFHMVALLQALPEYSAQLQDQTEGCALVRTIEAILAEPSQAETAYLGVLLQAQFGLHLLGFDPDSLAARSRDLESTVFLLDSTTLIPLLGRGSVGHPAAKQLLDSIKRVRASATTTDLLAVELAEHARWAMRALGSAQTINSVQGLGAAVGRAGARVNAFIEGCIAEAEAGQVLDLRRYIDAVAGDPSAHKGDDGVFENAIERLGVSCFEFREWDGVDDAMLAARDEAQEEIRQRRLKNNTFTHDRQVQAEAEAMLIIRGLRDGKLQLGGSRVTQAFFVSHSRVIDDVGKAGAAITMRPQAVQQWLSTLAGCGPDELAYIVNGMIWELSERGLAIVNGRRISTVFGPLISASREQMQAELAQYRDLVADRYGEDSASAFSDVDVLDLPFVAESMYAAKSRLLEEKLANETARRQIAERSAQISAADRAKLADFEAKKTAKIAANKRKKRKLAGRKQRRKSRR